MASELENERDVKSQRQGQWWRFLDEGQVYVHRRENTQHGFGESEESSMTENKGCRPWYNASSLLRAQLTEFRAWLLCCRKWGAVEGIRIIMLAL